MHVVTTRRFDKAFKKLHKNQKMDIENAIKLLIENPLLGQEKAGDLIGIRVHKFKMVGQLTLLAYIYENNILTLTLLAFGSHENFIGI